MVGWHHWLDGLEFEHALGVGDGQGSQACCSPMGLQRVRHDWATELYWTDTSSIWATILVFHVLGFLRASGGELLQPDGCWMAGFLSFLSFLRTYQLTVHDVCDCWWLWLPLFTDWEGIFHLSRFKLSSLFMSLLNNFSPFYSDDVRDKGEKAIQMKENIKSSSVQSLSCVWLFATPWTAACQACLSITNSQSLLKLMSVASVLGPALNQEWFHINILNYTGKDLFFFFPNKVIFTGSRH